MPLTAESNAIVTSNRNNWNILEPGGSLITIDSTFANTGM